MTTGECCVLLILAIGVLNLWSQISIFLFFSPAIKCQPLKSIVNGTISYPPTNSTQANYDLGTVVTYSCNTAFVLDLSGGGSEVRTCVDDDGKDTIGIFDRKAPTCARKSCTYHSICNIVN